jgi:hypothetical protein
MTDVTRILNAIERGNAKATDELLPLVYEELRLLAAQKLSREKPGQTLQATALVHEAYIDKVRCARGADLPVSQEQTADSLLAAGQTLSEHWYATAPVPYVISFGLRCRRNLPLHTGPIPA